MKKRKYVIIDKNSCIGCGQCVGVCPNSVLQLNDAGKAENTYAYCLRCMHCAAICPVQAITYDHEEAVLEETRPLPEDFTDNLEVMIKQRRSYRRFLPKAVAREDIEKVIEIADFSASAKNQHPTKWLLIQSEAVKDKLMAAILEFCETNQVSQEVIEGYQKNNNPVLGHNATILIGVCRDGAINAPADTAIAITNMELYLQSKGYGSFWGGYLSRFADGIPACREILGLPEDTHIYGSLLFGHPDQQSYRKLPIRVKPSTVVEIE